jgi:menaquinone-dependent protoporphyrinogen oxidase
VILGTAVYIGLWRREAVKFLKTFADELAKMPLRIFLSGPTGAGDPLELLGDWRFPESLRPMIEQIEPVEITCFGGRIESGRMNPFEKMIIKKVGAEIGDFRNWESIASWANGID